VLVTDRIVTRGKPMCAKCGHPVELLAEGYDHFTNRVSFRVVCHGEIETVTFDDCEMTEGKMHVDPSAGVAFQVRRLGE
jgi:hypothetical protein